MAKSKKCPTCDGSGYVKSAKKPKTKQRVDADELRKLGFPEPLIKEAKELEKSGVLDIAKPRCTGFDIRGWLKDTKEARQKASDDYYNRPDIKAQGEENSRRSNLPMEDPEHICGLFCDGQDGSNSDCCLVRTKLFGQWHLSDEEIARVKKVGTAPCYYCGEPVSNDRHRNIPPSRLDSCCPDDTRDLYCGS